MKLTPGLVLKDAKVRAILKQAWLDSKPGTDEAREEGGFILHDSSGSLTCTRWSTGAQSSIRVPSHRQCRFGDLDILASFHTHPNTGSDFLQEPSETDKRAVRDDPDLKGPHYLGEFVISEATVYLITSTGQVLEIDNTEAVFMEGGG